MVLIYYVCTCEGGRRRRGALREVTYIYSIVLDEMLKGQDDALLFWVRLLQGAYLQRRIRTDLGT